MNRQKQLPAAIAFSLTLFFFSCQKQSITERNEVSPERIAASKTKNHQELALLKQGLEERLQSLQATQREKSDGNNRFFLDQHPEYRSAVITALTNAATACNANTPINIWLGGELSDWTSTMRLYAQLTGMLDYPMYYSLIFENSSANQSFGINGEYTQKLTKNLKDLKRFWDINSADIVMVAMHGNTLMDREKIIMTDMALYGTTEAEAADWADLIIDIINAFPAYRSGNHPIFTFNAFAQKGFDPGPGYEYIPNKIVMGDGMMDGFKAIGFGDVAPQAILAHEFGHHIQYQLGLFTGTGPEATRRTELMADAFSAYYLAHSRGQSMNWKRVKQFLEVFFNIGDCSVTNNNHHGTPMQRMAAATWAYGVVEAAQKQGHILGARDFAAMFDAALPQILSN